MAESPAVCGKCRTELRIGSLNTDSLATCPSCYELSYGYVYPAWFNRQSTRISIEQADEGDADCFYHEGRRASAECASCGRLICSICDIQLSGVTHCPECVGKGRSTSASLKSTARRYDRLALLLSILPITIVGFYFSFISAPIALYLTIRYWSVKETLVPFNRWRFVVAALLSVATIIGWITLVYTLAFAQPEFEYE